MPPPKFSASASSYIPGQSPAAVQEKATEDSLDPDQLAARQELQKIFDSVQELLPDESFERIYDALYEAEFDVEAAVDLLLSSQGEGEAECPPAADAAAADPPAHAQAPPMQVSFEGLHIHDESAFPSLGPTSTSKPSASHGSDDEDDRYIRESLRYAAHAAAQLNAQDCSTSGRAARARVAAGVTLGGGVTSRLPKAHATWTVSTGAAVNAQYSELRAEARDLARARNAYFEQATKAYLAGNKALAKELGAKGRHLNERMSEAHARASGAMFASRNDGLNAGEGPRTIDLHGLHVAEAEAILERELGGTGRPVFLVVGQGRHTTAKAARLPVAVEAFLEAQGLRWKYEEPGLIKVL